MNLAPHWFRVWWSKLMLEIHYRKHTCPDCKKTWYHKESRFYCPYCGLYLWGCGNGD